MAFLSWLASSSEGSTGVLAIVERLRLHIHKSVSGGVVWTDGSSQRKQAVSLGAREPRSCLLHPILSVWPHGLSERQNTPGL